MHTLSRRDLLRRSSFAAGAGLLLPPSALPLAGRVRTERGEPVRLNANENPYGPSAEARAAMTAHWEEASRYGAPAIGELRDLVARREGVPADHVLVTQGSSEGLCATAAAYCSAGDEVVSADPTFEMFGRYARDCGATLVPVPVDRDLGHDFAAMADKVGARTRLCYVCNPGNPTGVVAKQAELESFAQSGNERTLMFVDEAYHDFVAEDSYRSLVPLIGQANLVVSRTMSKIHGMAGLRIGFLFAKPAIVARVRRFTMGSPNAMAARAAIAALQDQENQAFCRTKNAESRQILTDTLDGLGLRHVPSHTNFVFFDSGRPAREVSDGCARSGYLIGRTFAPLTNWCRVSLGTPEQMGGFVKVLREVLAG